MYHDVRVGSLRFVTANDRVFVYEMLHELAVLDYDYAIAFLKVFARAVNLKYNVVLGPPPVVRKGNCQSGKMRFYHNHNRFSNINRPNPREIKKAISVIQELIVKDTLES